jgi:hypothetical protein
MSLLKKRQSRVFGNSCFLPFMVLWAGYHPILLAYKPVPSSQLMVADKQKLSLDCGGQFASGQ